MAKPTKTKTPTSFKDLEYNFSKGELANMPRYDANQAPKAAHSTPPGHTATAAQTRASVRGGLSAHGHELLADLAASGLEDDVVIGDIGHEPVPVTPENLPAIINTEVVASGHAFPVRWHMVKNLPGYMSSAIRAMGRQVFAPITKTPIEEIQVLSSFTNTDAELAQMGNWIMKNGRRTDKMNMHFERLLTGYEAEVHCWEVAGYQFAIVKDFAGKYIYGWPSSHANNHTLPHATVRQIGRA